MTAVIAPAAGARRAGLAVTVLTGAFLAFDGVIHLLRPEQVDATMAELGWPVGLSPTLGALELACLALLLWRRTSPLGAVLLTGYLGGAVATNLRAGTPAFNVVFPVLVGAALWTGLALRDVRVRELVRSMARPD